MGEYDMLSILCMLGGLVILGGEMRSWTCWRYDRLGGLDMLGGNDRLGGLGMLGGYDRLGGLSMLGALGMIDGYDMFGGYDRLGGLVGSCESCSLLHFLYEFVLFDMCCYCCNSFFLSRSSQLC